MLICCKINLSVGGDISITYGYEGVSQKTSMFKIFQILGEFYFAILSLDGLETEGHK